MPNIHQGIPINSIKNQLDDIIKKASHLARLGIALFAFQAVIMEPKWGWL